VRCPFCKEDNDKVIDSRSSDAGRVIRRRRQCLACKRRFTTYEKTGDSIKLHVVKKDKSRVPYDRDKIIVGVQKACYKRPVSAEQIQQIADKAEEDIFHRFDKEVSSAFIGECVMKHLREVDKVVHPLRQRTAVRRRRAHRRSDTGDPESGRLTNQLFDA
jgi:transcriptional repressor NrdR